MADFDRLIEQANKTAQQWGGLVSLLLAIKAGRSAYVTFRPREAAFFVDGRKVGVELIRKELGRVELRIAVTIIAYNEKLWRGEWTIEKWRSEMEKLVRDSHYILGGLALGSLFAALDFDTVDRHVGRDVAALVRFARAFEIKQIPSLPLMQNRGRAYLRSFYMTYEQVNHQVHILGGFREGKRILTPAEHCRTRTHGHGVAEIGCFEAALRGWLPIASVAPIGTLICGQFCKCYIIYR